MKDKRSTLHVKEVLESTKELIRRYRDEHKVSSGRAVDELIALGAAKAEKQKETRK